jgi:hypothetical protein
MESQYDFFPFNLTEARDGTPVKKWVYKNKCVIENKIVGYHTFFCGYVVFPKKDIPADWWGNYDAPGLQQLAVHGGLTLCEIYEAKDQEEYVKKYELERVKLDSDRNVDFNKYAELKKELLFNLSKTPDGYVVFGFDCGHYNDDKNPDLKDPNHVMMLVEQMEDQLTEFAKVYNQYLECNTEEQAQLMEKVTADASLRTEMGIGRLPIMWEISLDTETTYILIYH